MRARQEQWQDEKPEKLHDSTPALSRYSQFPAILRSSPGPPRCTACLSEGVLNIVRGAGRSVCTPSYVRERIPTEFNSFWLQLQSGVWRCCVATPTLGSDLQVIFIKLLAAPSPLMRVLHLPPHKINSAAA